LRLSWSS